MRLSTANVSELLRVNPYYRLYRRSITLKTSLQARSEALERLGYPFATETTNPALRALLIDLTEFTSTVLLDTNTIKSHTHIPAPLLLPVKLVHESIFPGAPPVLRKAPNPLEAEVLKSMKYLSQMAKASEIAWCTTSEIALAAYEHRYMLFNTLTVDDYSYDAVFRPDSQAWKNYVQEIDRVFAIAAAGTIRAAKDIDYHSYIGVVEQGSKTGRLHIHALHFFTHLPDGWKDPNTGLAKPVKRIIDQARALWPYGHSMPIAVRYGTQDAYALSNWRWPEQKDGTGLKTQSPLALANYVTKYITKAYSTNASGGYSWRVRKSHQLGLKIPRAILHKTSTTTLLVLIQHQTIRVRLGNKLIPGALLRTLALREIQDRSSMIDLFTAATAAQPRPSLLQHSRDLIRTNAESNSASTTHLRTVTFSNEDIFNALEELRLLGRECSDTYFPRTPQTPRAIKVRTG